MHPLRFTFATVDDAQRVAALVESAYRGDASRAGWTTEADLLDGQRTDAAMIREDLAQPGTLILLGWDGSDLVACAELRNPPGTAAPTFGMFAVAPGRQGGGIGRQVLAEAERVARDRWSAAALELAVIDLRGELLDWYERRGYARTGDHWAFPYGDERYGTPRREDLRLAVLRKPLG